MGGYRLPGACFRKKIGEGEGAFPVADPRLQESGRFPLAFIDSGPMEAVAGRVSGHGWPRFRRTWRWRSAATVRRMPEGPAKTADSEKVPFKTVIVVFEGKLCSGASRLVGKGLNQLSWMEPKPLGPGLPVGKVWPALPWTRGDETILRSGKRIGPGHRQKRGIGWARWLRERQALSLPLWGGQVRAGAPSFQRGRVLGLLPDESGPASGAAMSC